MGMKKNLCRGIGSWSLPVLLSVFLFASCKDDLQTSVHTGPGIRFSVSDRADWHATRVVGSPEEETAPRDSLLGVLPLQAGDGSDGLYLHALLSDNTRDALPVDESIGTRSAPVKDMGSSPTSTRERGTVLLLPISCITRRFTMRAACGHLQWITTGQARAGSSVSSLMLHTTLRESCYPYLTKWDILISPIMFPKRYRTRKICSWPLLGRWRAIITPWLR